MVNVVQFVPPVKMLHATVSLVQVSELTHQFVNVQLDTSLMNTASVKYVHLNVLNVLLMLIIVLYVLMKE